MNGPRPLRVALLMDRSIRIVTSLEGESGLKIARSASLRV